MATVTLTARYLDQLKSHGKRYEVFDAIVPGLAIRVSASGRKTFTLYYRHRRRMRRVGLGRYPDVLLEKARKIATQHRGRIFDGADPAGEKQTEHAQDDNTVQALYELYRSRKEKVLRSWSEVRRILEKEVLPVWRHRRVADIRRRDVRELVEPKAQTAPIQGNRVLERISALFTFAVDQDWIEANPAWRIKKPGQERSRDRVLTRDELQELWPAWVGADPRAKGLAVDDVNDPDIANDPESQRSALQEACICGHVEIVKRLKPDPASDDLSELLREASTFAKRDVIAYLLSLGASPNDKPNGGSSALDGCLRALQWEDSHHFHPNRVTPASNLTKSRAVIGLLLERGALWRPDARTIADVRKALYHIDPEVITEITDRLRDRHACDEGVLHELVRTPKMQELLRASRRSKLEAEKATGSGRNRKGSAVASVPGTQGLPAAVARYLSQYDREHLYKQVWSAPMPTIAKHYGVTEVEIARACRHLHIPTPPQGHWAERGVGLQRSTPPPLPPLGVSRPNDQTDERSS